MMNKRNFFNVLAGIWGMAIAMLSLLPADIAVTSSLWDKLEHALAFFVFAGLIGLSREAWPGWRGWAAATVYGALIELGQLLSPGRFADPLDAIANATGAFFGILIVKAWQRQRHQKS